MQSIIKANNFVFIQIMSLVNNFISGLLISTIIKRPNQLCFFTKAIIKKKKQYKKRGRITSLYNLLTLFFFIIFFKKKEKTFKQLPKNSKQLLKKLYKYNNPYLLSVFINCLICQTNIRFKINFQLFSTI